MDGRKNTFIFRIINYAGKHLYPIRKMLIFRREKNNVHLICIYKITGTFLHFGNDGSYHFDDRNCTCIFWNFCPLECTFENWICTRKFSNISASPTVRTTRRALTPLPFIYFEAPRCDLKKNHLKLLLFTATSGLNF